MLNRTDSQIEQRKEKRIEIVKNKINVTIIYLNTIFNENRQFEINKKRTFIKSIIPM